MIEPGKPSPMSDLSAIRIASSWVRRLRDGRSLVLSIVDCPLPEGVHDAVASTVINFGLCRDETVEAQGKSYLDIIEEGWASVVDHRTTAIKALG